MKGPVEPISPGQFFWVTVVSVLAGGIYLWPQYSVSQAGTDAILSTLAVTAVSAAMLWMQCSWARKLEAASVVEGLQSTWGTIPAFALVGIGAVLMIALDSVLLSLYGDLLQTFFYPLTPRVVMVIAVAMAAAWVGMRSLAVVARNVQFWTPLIGIVFIAVVALAVPNATHLSAVRPAFPVNLAGSARASIGSWFLFANGGVAAGLSGSVRWKGKSRTGLLAAVATITQGLVLLILLALVIGTLGTPVVPELTWPIIYVFNLVTLRAFFVTGTGIFVVLIWSISMVLFLGVHLFHMSVNMEVMAGGPRRLYVFGAAAVLILGSFLIRTLLMAKVLLFDWIDPIYLIFIVGVVFITYGFTLVRRPRTSSSS